jgi:hypothetical protein
MDGRAGLCSVFWVRIVDEAAGFVLESSVCVLFCLGLKFADGADSLSEHQSCWRISSWRVWRLNRFCGRFFMCTAGIPQWELKSLFSLSSYNRAIENRGGKTLDQFCSRREILPKASQLINVCDVRMIHSQLIRLPPSAPRIAFKRGWEKLFMILESLCGEE